MSAPVFLILPAIRAYEASALTSSIGAVVGVDGATTTSGSPSRLAFVGVAGAPAPLVFSSLPPASPAATTPPSTIPAAPPAATSPAFSSSFGRGAVAASTGSFLSVVRAAGVGAPPTTSDAAAALAFSPLSPDPAAAVDGFFSLTTGAAVAPEAGVAVFLSFGLSSYDASSFGKQPRNDSSEGNSLRFFFVFVPAPAELAPAALGVV